MTSSYTNPTYHQSACKARFVVLGPGSTSHQMKLSFRTIEALGLLSDISPSLLIRGREVRAFSEKIGAHVEGRIDTPFPGQLAFRDSDKLLALLIELGGVRAELEVGAQGCTIISPDGDRATVATSRTLLKALLAQARSRQRAKLRQICRFTLPHTSLRMWQDALRLPTGRGKNVFRLVLEADGKQASLVLKRESEVGPAGGFGGFRMPIGTCRKNFKAGLSPSALSVLPSDDYHGVIAMDAKVGELTLTSKRRIAYAFELSFLP